jgi:hypothetical protein
VVLRAAPVVKEAPPLLPRRERQRLHPRAVRLDEGEEVRVVLHDDEPASDPGEARAGPDEGGAVEFGRGTVGVEEGLPPHQTGRERRVELSDDVHVPSLTDGSSTGPDPAA